MTSKKERHRRVFVLEKTFWEEIPNQLRGYYLKEEMYKQHIDYFSVKAIWSARGYYMLTLPPGSLTLDFRESNETNQQHIDELINYWKLQGGSTPLKSDQERSFNFIVDREIFTYGNERYFHQRLLKFIYEHSNYSYLVEAIYNFGLKAQQERGLIEPKLDPNYRKSVAYLLDAKKLKDRPIVNGKRARGPIWSSYEDDILRRYFAPDDNGKRFRMTPLAWQQLLDVHLRGLRSKTAVLARICYLNKQITDQYRVNGKVPDDWLPSVRAQRLGQFYRKFD
jgi:hypothetical protein